MPPPPLPNRVLTLTLKDERLEHMVGVFGMENLPAELVACSIGEDDTAIDAIPLLGVWNEDRGGIDGGGIGLMKLLPPPVELLVEGLSKLVQDASRKFWRSLEGVDDNIRLLEGCCAGERMEDTARFKRLLVGVLLKLNARLT